jgi:peptidoglycan pentaglycine glycine transferase (the first glycine)
MGEISPQEWDAFISGFPDPHILQTTPWGQLKANFGWKVVRVGVEAGGAQILIRRILPGINFAYIPKGPLGEHTNLLWPEIDAICRKNKCAFIKLEPDRWMTDLPSVAENDLPGTALLIHSRHNIQPMRTLVVDIGAEECQILARMKQKTRYNINLASKKNVVVKPYTDLSLFYNLMEITRQRDQFGIHSLEYYEKAYELFHARNMCQLLAAEFEGTAISALMVFRAGRRAWYFYGASSDVQRDKMPNYLLQWEAMRWAKSQGCVEYDLWGVPDADLETLEACFTTRSDGLWSVYRFKRGFGGELKRCAEPVDRVYNPLLYRLYSLWMRYRKIEG